MRRTISIVTGLLLAAAAALAGGRGAVDRPGEYVVRARVDGATAVVGYRLPATHPDPRYVALAVAISAAPGTTVELDRGSFTLRTPDRRIVPLLGREQFQEAGGRLRRYLARGDAVADSLAYAPAGRHDCRLGLFARPAGRIAREEVTVVGGATCSGWLVFEVPGGVKPGTWVLAIDGKGLETKIPFELPAGR